LSPLLNNDAAREVIEGVTLSEPDPPVCVALETVTCAVTVPAVDVAVKVHVCDPERTVTDVDPDAATLPMPWSIDTDVISVESGPTDHASV